MTTSGWRFTSTKTKVKCFIALLLALSLGTVFAPSLAVAGGGYLQWAEIDSPESADLCDIAVAPEPRSLFAATYNSTSHEVTIWRSGGTSLGVHWGSVLVINTDLSEIILRLSPNYSEDYTVYAIEVGGDLIMVSHNRGNSWEECHAPQSIVDLTVEDEDTVYIALPGGFVRKSTDAASTWQRSVHSDLSEINMLTVAEGGTVLVGSRNGEVAYSLDGGDTFSEVPDDVGAGDVQVMADINYRENGIIYASTDEGVYRWSIGVSTGWYRIVDESGVEGLALANEGTLYALKSDKYVIRLLDPSTSNGAEIDLIDLPAAGRFPVLILLSSSEQNEVWTIDTANDVICYFTDILYEVTPVLDTPADGATIALGACACVNHLSLSWNRLPEATTYEAAIYLDSNCTQRVWLGNSDSTSIMLGDNSTQLISGRTYYWRVRIVAPLKSPWSEPRSFTIGVGHVQPISPIGGTNDMPVSDIGFSWTSASSATKYEFTLSQNADLTDPIATVRVSSSAYTYAGTLDYDGSYFWGVRITEPAVGPLSVSTFRTKTFPVEVSPTGRVETASVITPIWVWTIIGICAALITVTLVLIFRKRQIMPF
jgi:photosystem II stability/assembly factor-like uncharacterized protein